MKRNILIGAAIVTGMIGIGGTAYAASNGGEPPSPVVSNVQTFNSGMFECYNGGTDSYAEFRLPVPHECYYPGDELVEVPAQVITLNFPAGQFPGVPTAETVTCTYSGNVQTSDPLKPSYNCAS
jgi:hypothetical protein